MLTTDVKSHTIDNEGRFAVGWQRLTRQEFLEAISAALLDKVQKHESEQAEKSGHFPDAPVHLAE
jgi:hypothetical protein